MREFYKNHKNLFFGGIAGLCLVICAAVLGIIILAGNDSKTAASDQKPKAVQAASNVNTVKEAEEEEEEVTNEAASAEPEVTPEAVEAELKAEEEGNADNVLDVVETPAPAVEKTAEPKPTVPPADDKNPAIDLSNMAQNVPYPFEIRVNKQMNCVTVYAMDLNGAYSIPYKAMVCSTGKATPLGTFHTPAKYRWKVLMGNVWGQYSTRVVGGILFHSVQYKSNRNDTLISSAYNKLGTTASHGCIRLTTIDAKWIYDNCPTGTTVIIYNDSNPGPLGKPKAMKVDASNRWDPTDPDPANPWKGRILRIEGVQNHQIERGSSIDLMAGVAAWDTSNNNVTGNVQISTNIDFNTVGIYGVHYIVTDSIGNTASEDATVTIVDTQAPVFAGVPTRIEGRRVSEITRELLLGGVSVTDNGQAFPMEWVDVQIPALHDGDNQILYIAKDASGNQAVASTIVYCDMTAPIITKKNGVSSILPLDQNLDSGMILSRIDVQDASSVNINYTLTPEVWGYKIDYTASDSYGNVSYFTDYVNYVEYEFTGNSRITVKSVENLGELLSGLQMKDSQEHIVSLPQNIQISTTKLNDTEYKVVYAYTYSSPVGTSTIKFERIAVLQGNQ